MKDNNSEIIFYEANDGQTKVEVRFDSETVWLSLDRIAELFGRDKSVISRNLKTFLMMANLMKVQLLQKMQQFKSKVKEKLSVR
ncbi:MAG: hypothetical protein ACR2MD_07690 [Aridibacter sp.]